MDALLAESFDRFVQGACGTEVVREVEGGGDAVALWAGVEGSGFLDLLVPESAGGAGAGLRDAFAPWLGCGRQLVPVPLAQTMWVRGALAASGQAAPTGPVAIATALRRAGPVLHTPAVPFGAVARAVLVAEGDGALLLPMAGAERRPTGVHGSLHADIEWPAVPEALATIEHDIAPAAALITATLIAGALDRLLAMTVQYANDRVQFGKPIGKFQAVQQQLAVLAEQVAAARMAAEIGCAETGVTPDPLRAAVAKARAAEAAEKSVAIAHAVHGAIGVTAEFDLQLVTRRLQQWRGDHGGAAHWHALLGRVLVSAQGQAVVPFLLDELLPPAQARDGE